MAVKTFLGRNFSKLLLNNARITATSLFNLDIASKVSVLQPKQKVLNCSLQQRWFSQSLAMKQQEAVDEDMDDEAKETEEKPVDFIQPVDLETSMDYMKSEAYKITYGDKLVWEPYKRNHKGPIPPPKTRKTCIRKNVMATGNPCPICRDQYLLVHPENLALLKQFVSPYTGRVISYEKTGVCQRQHKRILVAVQQAWDRGLLEMPLPDIYYNYAEFNPRPRRRRLNMEFPKSNET